MDPKAHRISPRTRFQSRKAARNRVENWRTDVDCFFLAPTRGGAPLRTRARTATRAGEPRSGSGAFQTRSFRLGAFHALPTRGGRRDLRRERPVEGLRAHHRRHERRSCCRAEQGGSAPRDDRGAFVPLGVQRPTGARGGAERSAMGVARVPSPEALTHRRVQLRDPGRDGGCVRGVRPGHRQAREHVRAHGGVLRARQRPCGRGHGRGHKRGNHHHEYVNAPPSWTGRSSRGFSFRVGSSIQTDAL